MERTLISWNLPNMITIPLMAAIGFLVVAVIWQVIAKNSGGGSAAPTGAGSY